MSRPVELNLTPPTFVVRNTVGREKEQTLKNPDRPASDAALWEYCDKNYHQLLPIIAEKVHNEKEVSQHSESRTLDARDLRRRLKSRRSRSTSRSPEPTSVFSRIQRDRSASPRRRQGDKRRRGEDVFHRLGIEEEVCPHIQNAATRKSSIEEEDLSKPWTCEESDPFTPRMRYFELPKKSRMPNNVKTYDESDNPEDHLKIFQAAAKVERWTMPTWCHMFNSTLTGSARVWFDDLPPESIDSYDDLKKAFLANYLQQKKCVKDPVEIHHIKQREGESTKDSVRSFATNDYSRGKKNSNKFCEFHREVGHNTDECVHLKRQIEELIKNGKLSHVIRELKQGSGKDRPKTAKNGGNIRKGQASSNLDGSVVTKSRQAKNCTKFLSKSGNFVPTLRR
ncbi:reverse transcriptase domain-containing protein [Tanacetum coccineum]|uniref:Reverse transcriptase domain-containing protein n=1 Tax=Tanacetum coccineum TaxID=301880 RepID=A0ABQ4X7K4_9ASTR